MKVQDPAEPLSYERLARITGRHRWWRPLAGTFVLLVLAILGTGVVYGTAGIVGELRNTPLDADGWPLFDDVVDVAVELLAVATLLPAVALTVRWIQKRPWGSVSSVVGRLRWPWFGVCLVVAAPAVVVSMVGGVVLTSLTEPVVTPAEEDIWVGWGTFLAGLVIVSHLVPLQAAAEEYLFRGWLLQATGAFFRSPWVVLAPQALLFAAAHGWGTPWGFTNLAVFGVLAGWLTIHTGGLEAAVALHVMTNVISMAPAAAFAGGLASDGTAADMPWSMALFDMAVCYLFAVVILRLARRRNLATHFVPPHDPHDPQDAIYDPPGASASRPAPDALPRRW